VLIPISHPTVVRRVRTRVLATWKVGRGVARQHVFYILLRQLADLGWDVFGALIVPSFCIMNGLSPDLDFKGREVYYSRASSSSPFTGNLRYTRCAR
jgi:hypothetical protein